MSKHFKNFFVVSLILVLGGVFLLSSFVFKKAQAEERGSFKFKVTLNDNGLIYKFEELQEITVQDFLAEKGIELQAKDEVWPAQEDILKNGSVVFVERARKVTLSDFKEGEMIEKEWETHKETIGEVLEEMDIEVGSGDYLSPRVEKYLENGEKIKITRVEVEEEIETKDIPYEVIKRNDNNLLKGKTKVTQQGENGKRKLVYRTFWHNGEMVGKDLIENTILEKSQDKIILIGTKVEVLATEKGGASWYDAPSMTAAHKTFPKGSRVRVTNLNNGKVVIVTIADRGPYISGRIVDLSRDAFSQIASLGSGTASVKIELLNNN